MSLLLGIDWGGAGIVKLDFLYLLIYSVCSLVASSV